MTTLIASGSGTTEGAQGGGTEDNRVFLSINRANRSESRFALGAVLVSGVIFLAALPRQSPELVRDAADVLDEVGRHLAGVADAVAAQRQ